MKPEPGLFWICLTSRIGARRRGSPADLPKKDVKKMKRDKADLPRSYIAKSVAAVANTDGNRMLGDLLEETNDLGLGLKKLLNWSFLFQMRYPAFGKSIRKCFRARNAWNKIVLCIFEIVNQHSLVESLNNLHIEALLRRGSEWRER